MAYKEKLSSVEKEMIVADEGLKITEDPFLLVKIVKKFIDGKKFKNKELDVLEIGSGQGIIPLILSNSKNIKKIYAVEIQKNIYEYLVENIERNEVGDKIIGLNEDIKEIKGEYDIILSNPPYRKLNSGKLPNSTSEKISKYEEKLTLKELFAEIKRLLKNYGYFFVIIPEDRLNDSFTYIYENKLDIIEMNITEFKKKKLIVISGKKGGEKNSNIKINVEKINREVIQ